ncbi:MAG: hypothetical protein RQ826_14965 [Xanthomonadales bacterium]|nr:hypothetical protein [Xanthomonadales bacterium]
MKRLNEQFRKSIGVVSLITAMMLGAPAVNAEGIPKERLEAILNIGQLFVRDLVTESCGSLTADMDPGTPLYLVPISLAEQGICDDIAPVLAPDGEHLTLGEWLPATGRISIKCQEPGTRYHLQFKNLVPHGVYTVWHFTATGGGALASHPPDDIRNVFIADGEGNANHVALGTAGEMTLFGEIGDCSLPINLETDAFFVVYHTDNMSWGPVPGPEDTAVAHMIIVGF